MLDECLGLEARLERAKGTRRQVVGYFESRPAWRSAALFAYHFNRIHRALRVPSAMVGSATDRFSVKRSAQEEGYQI